MNQFKNLTISKARDLLDKGDITALELTEYYLNNINSSKKLNYFLHKDLDPSKLDITKNLTFQDLVNSANGSPGNLCKNIEIWKELSDEITSKLNFPLKDNLEILQVCKSISEQLEIYQQICLINLIQQIWWRKTRNINLVKKLEKLKLHIKNNIQPRLAWEVTLLKIAIEDL